MVRSSWPKSWREFTRFIWWMQTERRVAVSLQTKPVDLGWVCWKSAAVRRRANVRSPRVHSGVLVGYQRPVCVLTIKTGYHCYARVSTQRIWLARPSVRLSFCLSVRLSHAADRTETSRSANQRRLATRFLVPVIAVSLCHYLRYLCISNAII